jgi:hypothetical protein
VSGALGALPAALVLWLALFPALQAAHLAFADHGHRYCPEHLRIEDVRLDGATARRGGPATDRVAGLRLRAAPGPRSGACPPDALLNFSLSRLPAVAADLPDASEPVCTHLAAPRFQSDGASQSPLVVAPKTSPPAVALA